jgi:guanylate kinase
MTNTQGKCIIFSAPSGAGKTTIVRHLLNNTELPLGFSVSATSRAPRTHEVDGVDYHFIDADSFRNLIQQKAFIEWEEVYEDHFYGTLKSELERHWSAGKAVVFDVDVVGGLNLKKIFGKQALALFIQAPSIDALEERLRKRKTETEERIQLRVAKAKKEMEFAQDFDAIIVNEDLDSAFTRAEELVGKFIES